MTAGQFKKSPYLDAAIAATLHKTLTRSRGKFVRSANRTIRDDNSRGFSRFFLENDDLSFTIDVVICCDFHSLINTSVQNSWRRSTAWHTWLVIWRWSTAIKFPGLFVYFPGLVIRFASSLGLIYSRVVAILFFIRKKANKLDRLPTWIDFAAG